MFHSHAFSIFFNVFAGADELPAHFAKNPIFAMDDVPGGPSPVSVGGSDKIHIQRFRSTGQTPGGYALWAVADNLRITAANAIQTAEHIMLAPALEA